MFDKIEEKYSRLAVIYNNAGIVSSHGRLHEIPNDKYSQLIDINQTGAFYVLKWESIEILLRNFPIKISTQDEKSVDGSEILKVHFDSWEESSQKSS